jgi:hypothetical protein
VTSVLPGVVRLLIGDQVDRDQGAVEDRVRQAADSAHRGVQIVGGRGEQVDRFADVSPGGGHADFEAAGQTGVGVAVAQVRQGEQGLPGGVEATPPRSALFTVSADEAGEVVQGSGGQRNRGRV